MKLELLQFLVCPKCKHDMVLISTETAKNNEIKEGKLACPSCDVEYPIVNYIPRFVIGDSYVDNFSYEWEKHRTTQLDSISGLKESDNSFKLKTGFDVDALKGKLVLDVGCGSGRYLEIAEKYGATVIGIDLSYAVDSAQENLGHKSNVHIIQADVFNLPFKEGIFDYIYSIGVLHHTPSTEKAFKCLPRLLKSGGEIAIWVYSNEGIPTKAYNLMSGFYRLFTTRLPKSVVYWLANISTLLYYMKQIKFLKSFAYLIFPASDHPVKEWRILDTFDWYSPKYQFKHTYNEVVGWFKDMGLEDIKRLDFPVSVKGKRP